MSLVATTVDSPLGRLRLVASGRGLRSLGFDPGRWAVTAAHDAAEAVPRGRAPILDAAADELAAYLDGGSVTFRTPLDLADATRFQRQVLEAMIAVPYGGLTTYGDLARAVGQPGGARAVGRACNTNPLPIVVPCHRVVAADGSLGGYAAGTAVKRHLLQLERGVAIPPGGWESRSARARAEADAPRLF